MFENLIKNENSMRAVIFLQIIIAERQQYNNTSGI